MAYKIAIASGNWNDPATWEDGVVPSGTDDVWANGYSISINQNLTFSGTLRNTSVPTILPYSAIPVMTDYSVPSGIASAYANSQPAWRAFNKNYGDYWQGSTSFPGWLKYQFTSSKIIKRYAFATYYDNRYNPNNWTFEASNDNTNWTVLETVTNNTITGGQWYISAVLANTTSYLYYRINITSTVGGTAFTPLIMELEMTESTNSVYGSVTTANYGGNYILGAGYTFNVTNIYSDSRVSTGCIQYNASGTSTIICPNLTSTQAPATIYVTGTGTLNINSVIGSTAVHLNACAILTVGAASNPTINIQGNIVGGYGYSGSSSEINLIGNATINIIGNVYAGLSSDSYVIRTQSGSSTINITGDVYGGSGSSYVFAAANGTTINITGNVTAGSQPIINTGATIVMSVVGNLIASTTYAIYLQGADTLTLTGSLVPSTTSPALYNAASSSLTVIPSSTLTNISGVMPLIAARVKYTAASRTWTFQKPNNTNKLIYTSDLVSSGSGSYPLAANVRNGVSYGLGAYTGTMVVPAYQNVAYGIDVEAGKGVAYLSAASLNDISAAVWNQLISNITTTGSIGERLKNASTVATTGQQIAGFDI